MYFLFLLIIGIKNLYFVPFEQKPYYSNTYILPAGNTPYRKRQETRTIYITPLESILDEGLHSRQYCLVRLNNQFNAFFNPKNASETKASTKNIKCSTQILLELLSGNAVRTGMVWRPSSYAKLIQPTTQPKQTNPQPNPNTALLRILIIIVNIYRTAQEIRPSRWVSKS